MFKESYWPEGRIQSVDRSEWLFSLLGPPGGGFIACELKIRMNQEKQSRQWQIPRLVGIEEVSRASMLSCSIDPTVPERKYLRSCVSHNSAPWSRRSRRKGATLLVKKTSHFLDRTWTWETYSPNPCNVKSEYGVDDRHASANKKSALFLVELSPIDFLRKH